MAQAATKNVSHAGHKEKNAPQKAQQPARPENSAGNTSAATPEKKRGRPANPDGKKTPLGKDLYPGCVGGKLLQSVPEDWNAETHKRLRAENFATPELFAAYTAKYPRERKNEFSGLVNDAGQDVFLSEFPANVSVSLGENSFSFKENGQEILPLRKRHFSDRRVLARACLAALQKEISRFEKIANMTDEQIANMAAGESAKKSLGKAAEKIATISQDEVERMLGDLSPEVRAKLLAGLQTVGS